MDQNLTQNVDTLFTNMENFTQREGLIGKAVTHGDKTFLPVVSVTLGYGSGASGNKTSGQGNTPANMPMGGSNSSNASMNGGALGFGAKLFTEAVIIIDKENVTMVPMSGTSNVSQLIDKIPQMVSGMNGGQQNNQNNQNNQNTNTPNGQ